MLSVPKSRTFKEFLRLTQAAGNGLQTCAVRHSSDNFEAYGKGQNHGTFGYRGPARPGYPYNFPRRLPGADLNLQERLDELYKEKNEKLAKRKNIGFPRKKVETPLNNRTKRMAWEKKLRQNPELERAARLGILEVSEAEIRSEHIASGANLMAVFEAAELYGVFDDLFEDAVFNPAVNLNVEYDHDDGETVTPVFRGNVVKPSEATTAPRASWNPISADEKEEDSLWTLVLTNPDGNFDHQADMENLHWMVGNIQGCEIRENNHEVLCDYMRPFPPFGTGFHRMIFVLYKQKTKIDFSSEQREGQCLDLTQRNFKTKDFWAKFGSDLTPAGLAFYQSDYDSSLKSFFHDVLDMKEPRYEYHFMPPAIRPWSTRFNRENHEGFNYFLDKHRDPKEIAAEVVTKKLATHHPFEGDLESDVKYVNAQPIDHNEDPWRRREIERERLRQGVYKDMDWKELRRDPSDA